MFRVIMIILAGAMGTFLANRDIAYFNDACRILSPEYREGRMSRTQFAATCFAVSIGLAVGFGLPFSVMSPIILMHTIWLSTDIIGAVLPGKRENANKYGAILSLVLGGAFGVALLFGLEGIVAGMQALPVNIFDSWMALGGPIIYAFAAFPCLAIAMDHGWKKGLISLALVVIIRQIFIAIGQAGIAEGIALCVGIILVIIFAIRDKTPSEGDLSSLFGERVKNIKKNVLWIAVMGAIYAICVNIALIGEGPQSLIAMKDGAIQSAIGISFARALSFIPLVGVTSLMSGAFCVSGFGFTAVVGLLAPNPVFAGVLGAVVMSLEALSLVGVAKLFDKFPGLKKSGDTMRAAMSKLLEIALLVGSMIAANSMAPGLGYVAVAGMYVINEYLDRPLVRMVVGPVATIVVGILVNLFAVIGI